MCRQEANKRLIVNVVCGIVSVATCACGPLLWQRRKPIYIYTYATLPLPE